MKNTLENKAKFFALYWGQEILAVPYHSTRFMPVHVYSGMDVRQYFLELKSSSQISDDDAQELNVLHATEYTPNGYYAYVYLSEYRPKFNIWTVEQVDFLRFKGYALPWNGITVEEMIEWGWIKLTT